MASRCIAHTDVTDGARLDLEFADGHRTAMAGDTPAKAVPDKSHARAPEDSAGFAVLTLLALFADIHGNREALDACLADAQRRGAETADFSGGYDRLWRRSSLCRRSRRRTATRWRHGCPRQSRRRADRRLRQYEQRRGRIDRMDGAGGSTKTSRISSAGLPLTAERGDLLFVHAEAGPNRGSGRM